ncbi:LANO_0F09032g1_1 [Lachancea nothofagi CBS 11611]|uniref:LANO_0F09032g1_1 n=1 Tax=Lachancea nothofagi CBS 11611 TaxID=1266666 RepID=A0A1G4K9S0_9SACH|nr:LANO_0F09032g1_1 [Lachancea nothofagi CBS 11611]
MAVKKRKPHNIKPIRNVQDGQPTHNPYDSVRLKPEKVGALVHDESDTISYRAYLTQNFIKSSEWMDVLTTQNVPLQCIQPPPIYRDLNVEAMKQSIAAEKEQISALECQLENYSIELPKDFIKLRDLSVALANDSGDRKSTEPIEIEFMSEFGKHLQDGRISIHHQKFPQLRGDLSEAPVDYWAKRTEMLIKQHEETVRLKELQEEEELKRRTEEQDRLRQKQEEQRLFEDPFQPQQPQVQPIPSVMAYNVNGNQAQPQQADAAQQGMLGSIFGDMNGENFNNGFEDEFGELDTAFF